MTIVFITNYMTHHQLPFCEELYRLLGDDFTFIATNKMEDERKKMGWEIDVDSLPYYRDYVDGISDHVVNESDIVICGGTHDLYIKDRIDNNKITFRYFERLYKTGRWHAFAPRGYLRKLKNHTSYNNKPVYLLCAGAYVAADFSLFGAYRGKRLKWGYFPQFIEYDKNVIKRRLGKELRLLWTGRMINWKHGIDAVICLKDLQTRGISARLTMIGEGPMRKEIEEYIENNKLSSFVSIKNFMTPQKIRAQMLEHDIYLMTSDYEEGWGAVVNEAMNAGMIVLASHGAGSVPYLIKHGYNGMVYKCGQVSMMAECIAELVNDDSLASDISINAYDTIKNIWNEKVAAKRIYEMSMELLKGEFNPVKDGPLSMAEVISPLSGYVYSRRK